MIDFEDISNIKKWTMKIKRYIIKTQIMYEYMNMPLTIGRHSLLRFWVCNWIGNSSLEYISSLHQSLIPRKDNVLSWIIQKKSLIDLISLKYSMYGKISILEKQRSEEVLKHFNISILTYRENYHFVLVKILV